METYLNFLRAWFSFPQQAWSVTRSTVDREIHIAQEAVHRVQDHQSGHHAQGTQPEVF
jgi:hypothetical protein